MSSAGSAGGSQQKKEESKRWCVQERKVVRPPGGLWEKVDGESGAQGDPAGRPGRSCTPWTAVRVWTAMLPLQPKVERIQEAGTLSLEAAMKI